MTDKEENHELLIRYLDDDLGQDEQARVFELLRTDVGARNFLRSVAEQAVTVADIERTDAARHGELAADAPTLATDQPEPSDGKKIVRLEILKWALPLAAMFVLLFGTVIFALMKDTTTVVATIRGMGGDSIEWIGSDGQIIHDLKVGDSIEAGVDIRTLSGNAWLSLKLRNGSKIIITSQSRLTAYETEDGDVALRLLEGNLWGTTAVGPLSITTPAARFSGSDDSQFHIETGESSSNMRVYKGMVGVRRPADREVVEVEANYQIAVSLDNPRRLIAVQQPDPVNFWNCRMLESPDAVVGTWAPPNAKERIRLRAKPVPIENRNGTPMTIYVSLFRVASSGSPSVLLESDSVIRIRGRTSADAKIRFGVATQKMRGLFSGKYRTRLEEDFERSEDGSWTVELPVARMGLLGGKDFFAKSPIGAELNSIMVYTVDQDVDLEIHQVDLLPHPTKK